VQTRRLIASFETFTRSVEHTRPEKFQLPVKGGAWLRRFDDVTRVEKSCVAKGMNRKKEKIFYYWK